MTGFICIAPLITFIGTSKSSSPDIKKNAYTGIRNVKEVSKRSVLSYKMEPTYRKITN